MSKIIICSEASISKGVIIDQHGNVELESGMVISNHELGIVADMMVVAARKNNVKALVTALDHPERVVQESRKLRANIVSGRRIL